MKRTPAHLLLTVLLSFHPCSAAFEHVFVSAPSAAMGGVLGAPDDPATALLGNPAELDRLDGHALFAACSRPFGLDDLGLSSLGYTHATGKCGWGLGWRSFGNSAYRENTFSLACGRALGGGLTLGATLQLMSLAIDGFGSASACGLGLGCRVPVNDRLQAAMSGGNVNAPRLGQSGERLPSWICLGLSSQPSRGLTMVAEIYKETESPARFRLGQESRPSAQLSVRLGLSTGPTNITGGAGFHFRRFRIDYACTSHPVLGMTHQLSLTIHLGRTPQLNHNHKDG